MSRPGEAITHGPDWLLRAALIARRFHLEGRSKTEIAEETGLSRFKVARILDEAHRLGLVQVSVRLPARIEPDLSRRVGERFGLNRAVVVEGPADSPADSPASSPASSLAGSAAATREDLGRVTAQLLGELVEDHDVLGLTCSRTVALTTQQLVRLARCPVVQLSGTLAGPDVEAGSVESVRRAAHIGGGKAFPIYAPMVLPDAASARSLAGQRDIRQTLEQIDRVTVATVAVGGWSAGLSTVWDTIGPEDRSTVAGAAVGEIAGRLFDARGTAIDSPVEDRVLGATLNQYRKIPEVIAIAYGELRADAVRAVLRGRVLNSLVCDDALARALLDTAEDAEPSAVGVA